MGTARRARLAAATAAVLALASCTPALAPARSSPGHGHGAGPESGTVIALNHITTLRTLFNRAAGHPRLILIFSPT